MCMIVKAVTVSLGPLGMCFVFCGCSAGLTNRSLVLVMLKEEDRYDVSSVPCNIHWIFLFHLLSGMFDTPSY